MTVPWGELEGYRDGSSHYVQLVRRGGLVTRGELGVPTRGEDERTALLAHLDRQGLRRLD